METKTLNVDIQKAANGKDAVFCVSSINPDRVGDTFSPAALKKLADSMDKVVALWNHKADQVCGYFSDFSYSGGRLVASLKLADTNLAKMIRALLDSDVPLGASVGFRAESKQNRFGGREFTGDVDLMEISVVSTPANSDAVLLAKQYGFSSDIFDKSSEGASQSPVSWKAVEDGIKASEKAETLKRLNQSIERIENVYLRKD